MAALTRFRQPVAIDSCLEPIKRAYCRHPDDDRGEGCEDEDCYQQMRDAQAREPFSVSANAEKDAKDTASHSPRWNADDDSSHPATIEAVVKAPCQNFKPDERSGQQACGSEDDFPHKERFRLAV
jgi:hypothetical protein